VIEALLSGWLMPERVKKRIHDGFSFITEGSVSVTVAVLGNIQGSK
jgi:hypothetical protein